MLTRCTTCNTWFRLGQDDIRAAHGEVRCGACGARFNALATLCDTLPAGASEYTPIEPPTAAPDPTAAADLPVAEEFALPSEAALADEPVEAVFPEKESTPAEPIIQPEPAADANTEAAFSLPETMGPAEAPVTFAPRAERPAATAKSTGERRRAVPSWVWRTIGSVVLLLALLSQIVIYEHAALRANPVTRGAVEALYSAFGHPLPLRSDLSALVVTNAEVTATPDAPNALKVTARLTNHADFAQAWPLLRVVLTDRYGSVVAQGLYDAGAYLPHGAVAGSALAAGQTRKVEMDIGDPGAGAVGFVLVACLPGENGPVCAGEAQTGR